jgi:hypothetical protein
MNELAVILKNSDRVYRQKFLIYQNYSVAIDDPVVRTCIDEAMKNFEGEPENIYIKIHLEIQ